MQGVVSKVGGSSSRGRMDRIIGLRAHFSKQLMTPEWMVDMPEGMNGKGSAQGEGWYVMPRPEGKRCLVISANGITTSRGKFSPGCFQLAYCSYAQKLK